MEPRVGQVLRCILSTHYFYNPKVDCLLLNQLYIVTHICKKGKAVVHTDHIDRDIGWIPERFSLVCNSVNELTKLERLIYGI